MPRVLCVETAMADAEPAPLVPNPATAGSEATAIPQKPLSEAARRALAEAEARRAQIDSRAAEIAAVQEKDGRGGAEPVRYGDWEVKGLASDF